MTSSTKKCLIWDLDNTLWDGVCLEGDVRLRPEAAIAITELDRRGILFSIASRGEADVSMEQLKAFGLDQYFLVPKVNWLPKTTNIIAIGRELGLSLDDVAFVDDEPFELEQVSMMLPSVLTIDAREVADLPNSSAFTPTSVTSEGRIRRQLYQADEARAAAKVQHTSREDFLHSCDMRLVVRPMEESDVPRVRELMTRTHQLNTTGLLLSPEEILDLMESGNGERRVAVAELTDRFGSYGTIGVSIADTSGDCWTLSYLALSCRVLGRGVERAFLSRLLDGAARQGSRFARAHFRNTGRNRQMLVLYHITGFRSDESSRDGETMVLTMDLDGIPDPPSWITIS
jgi:FkbH-like protein